MCVFEHHNIKFFPIVTSTYAHTHTYVHACIDSIFHFDVKYCNDEIVSIHFPISNVETIFISRVLALEKTFTSSSHPYTALFTLCTHT